MVYSFHGWTDSWADGKNDIEKWVPRLTNPDGRYSIAINAIYIYIFLESQHQGTILYFKNKAIYLIINYFLTRHI